MKFITSYANISRCKTREPLKAFLGSTSRAIGQNIQFQSINLAISTGYMTNAKTISTPLEPGCQLLKATQTDKLCDPTCYQELTGSLNHLTVFSHPYISFAVSKLAQFNVNPTMTHWKASLHVLSYLKSTRNYCII